MENISNTVQYTIRLSEENKRDLQHYSKEAGKTVGELISEMIKLYEEKNLKFLNQFNIDEDLKPILNEKVFENIEFLTFLKKEKLKEIKEHIANDIFVVIIGDEDKNLFRLKNADIKKDMNKECMVDLVDDKAFLINKDEEILGELQVIEELEASFFNLNEIRKKESTIKARFKIYDIPYIEI